MRVAWVQDMDPLVQGGGAQLNDRAMIEYGLRHGEEVQLLLPTINMQELDRPDLVVISNAVGLGTGFYEDLIKKDIPYAFFVHDYGPWLCKWRLLYPMEERCRTTCFLRPRWKEILEFSRTFIWLSPLHRWAWLWGIPDLEGHRHTLVPSAVEEKRFFDMGEARAGALAVNSGAEFKGWPIVRAWAEAHPDVKLTLVGPAGPEAPPNVEAIGDVPYAAMNALYNKHQYFVHLPDRPAPFDRTIVEAYLAGCQLLANKNVGALSYPWFKKGRERVRQELRRSPGAFWSELYACIGQTQGAAMHLSASRQL